MKTPDEVEVRIGLPLPMDVVGSIMKAMAIMYPNGSIDPSRARDREMVLVLRDIDRRPRGSKRALAAAKDRADEDPKMDGLLVEWNEQGMGMSLPEYARLRLAEICVAMLAELPESEVENYLESEVTAPDGTRYAVAACRGIKRTPHALRMAAEAKLAVVAAERDRLRDALLDVQAVQQELNDSGNPILQSAAGRLNGIKAHLWTPDELESRGISEDARGNQP